MQTVSQMGNFTSIFSCHEWCCLSGLWALCSLDCRSFPPGFPPELLSFSQGRKGDLDSSKFPSPYFFVVWLVTASFVCESVGMQSAAAISMLMAAPRQSKQGCSCRTVAVPPKQRPGSRCGESPAPESCSVILWMLPRLLCLPVFYQNRGLCPRLRFCSSLTLHVAPPVGGLRWEASENIKLYVISFLVRIPAIAVVDPAMYIS